MEIILHDGTKKERIVNNVIDVLYLEYNLVSASRAIDAGKTVDLDKSVCDFRNRAEEVIDTHHRKCAIKAPRL